MKLIACKNLDHNPDNYPRNELKTCGDELPGVKYWRRPECFGPNLNVQFCNKKGRINSMIDCYESGFMPCYDPVDRK